MAEKELQDPAEDDTRQYVDSDVLAEIDRVDKAIVARLALSNDKATSTEPKQRAEELVCIATRALFSTYKDSVLWSGVLHTQTRDRVREVLEAARRSLTTDRRCESSVAKRLKAIDTIDPGRVHLLSVPHSGS